MALATASGVSVEQMAPAKVALRPAPAPGQADAQDARDVTVAYSISATGSYTSAAAFLRGLRTGMGHCAIRSAKLIPTQDDRAQTVRLTVETEHYAFDATPAPAPAEGPRAAGAEEGH
jgi:hypothetical protein